MPDIIDQYAYVCMGLCRVQTQTIMLPLLFLCGISSKKKILPPQFTRILMVGQDYLCKIRLLTPTKKQYYKF